MTALSEGVNLNSQTLAEFSTREILTRHSSYQIGRNLRQFLAAPEILDQLTLGDASGLDKVAQIVLASRNPFGVLASTEAFVEYDDLVIQLASAIEGDDIDPGQLPVRPDGRPDTNALRGNLFERIGELSQTDLVELTNRVIAGSIVDKRQRQYVRTNVGINYLNIGFNGGNDEASVSGGLEAIRFDTRLLAYALNEVNVNLSGAEGNDNLEINFAQGVKGGSLTRPALHFNFVDRVRATVEGQAVSISRFMASHIDFRAGSDGSFIGEVNGSVAVGKKGVVELRTVGQLGKVDSKGKLDIAVVDGGEVNTSGEAQTQVGRFLSGRFNTEGIVSSRPTNTRIDTVESGQFKATRGTVVIGRIWKATQDLAPDHGLTAPVTFEVGDNGIIATEGSVGREFKVVSPKELFTTDTRLWIHSRGADSGLHDLVISHNMDGDDVSIVGEVNNGQDSFVANRGNGLVWRFADRGNARHSLQKWSTAHVSGWGGYQKGDVRLGYAHGRLLLAADCRNSTNDVVGAQAAVIYKRLSQNRVIFPRS